MSTQAMSGHLNPDRGTYRGTNRATGAKPGNTLAPRSGTAKAPEMLTDTECRKAICPSDRKRLRLTDANGLYLEVSPAGSKRWFWKFYPDGKDSRMGLGSYPVVTLKAARLARDEARKARQAGTNPVQKRQADKLAKATSNATTFEAVAREFHALQIQWSESHATQWLRCMANDLFPWVGSLPIAEVTAPALLHALRRVEARAGQLPHDLREWAGQTFRYGIATGRCERNPAVDLIGALKSHTVKHAAAVLEPAKVGALLRAMDAYAGHPCTRAALPLSALLFQRPGNIRTMEWAEVDTETALWTIPSDKMKRTKEGKANGRPHLVPLAPQALAILADIRPLTGHGRYVFPSIRTGERPMSDNTIRAALQGMGYTNDDMSAHGFRATARTIMAERLSINPEVIEAQLAHGKSGPLGMAYDRTQFMDQRRLMMITWADYLDTLRAGAQIIPIKAA